MVCKQHQGRFHHLERNPCSAFQLWWRPICFPSVHFLFWTFHLNGVTYVWPLVRGFFSRSAGEVATWSSSLLRRNWVHILHLVGPFTPRAGSLCPLWMEPM